MYYQAILCRWSPSIPPENIKGIGRDQWHQMSTIVKRNSVSKNQGRMSGKIMAISQLRKIISIEKASF